MSRSGAYLRLSACVFQAACRFFLDVPNAVSTVAAPGSVFIYILKSSRVVSKFFRGEQIHQAVARK